MKITLSDFNNTQSTYALQYNTSILYQWSWSSEFFPANYTTTNSIGAFFFFCLCNIKDGPLEKLLGGGELQKIHAMEIWEEKSHAQRVAQKKSSCIWKKYSYKGTVNENKIVHLEKYPPPLPSPMVLLQELIHCTITPVISWVYVFNVCNIM